MALAVHTCHTAHPVGSFAKAMMVLPPLTGPAGRGTEPPAQTGEEEELTAMHTCRGACQAQATDLVQLEPSSRLTMQDAPLQGIMCPIPTLPLHISLHMNVQQISSFLQYQGQAQAARTKVMSLSQPTDIAHVKYEIYSNFFQPFLLKREYLIHMIKHLYLGNASS